MQNFRPPALKACLFAFACTSCLVVPACGATAEKPEPGSNIKLERVPPMTPQKSLASAEVVPGFRMELVAAEPQVIDPIAISFDEAGRMYVVEMRDYSEQDKAFLGRIRLLTDEDGDGSYETSRVFLDHLSWPTAVTCYDGGVFVGDPPNIYYCKDTNGDGVADVKKVLFTGFSRKNVQGMMNSLQWGFDHRIYGTSSSTGGEVSRVVRGSPDAAHAPLDLHNRDFAFDPKTLEMSPLTGGGQHGMSFNRWGDRFLCSNGDHLQAIVFEEKYLARNLYQSVVSARRSIAADGPQAEVYRISPMEAWRVARTKLRVAGLVSGPTEGGHAAGYFTSASGVKVYEGGLWATDPPGMVFICEPAGNLIHRKKLVPDGVTYRGERIDKQKEFVAARDIWFRPVQLAIGPEGGLYVADMYREVIEHPESLPAALKRQLDLNSGNDKGRIYRIVPADYHYKKPKMLDKATAADLVDTLEDINQWRRMTALRLIFERQDPSIAALVRSKYENCKRPECRIAMLYAIDSLNALTEADLLKGLNDPHPQVRRHALRLSEPMLDKSTALREKAISLTADSDPVVQFQLAFTLGETRDPAATKALADILIRSSQSLDITDAVLTSIVDRAGGVLKALLADEKWCASQSAEPIVGAIVGQIARQRHDEDLNILVELLQPSSNSARRSPSAVVLLKALSRLPAGVLNGNSPQFVKLRNVRAAAAKSLVQEARQVLARPNASLEERAAAVDDLALDKFENQREALDNLLSPQEPTAIHAAVLATCGQYDSPAVADLILSHWEELSPAERLQAADILLRRGTWALAFVKHLAKSGASLNGLDPSHTARLQNYPSPKVRQLARKLRGQSVAKDRQKVFQEYRDGGALAGGDPAQGKLIFEKDCATCHQVGGIGHQVGPNLATMVSRGAESVLFNVLAPNAEVDPRFIEYVVATNSGQVLNGVIAGETSTAVTLRGADEKTTTILRVDIDEIHSTGKSLMPEGFEKVIDKKSMANLLSFLQQAAASPGAGK